MILQGDWDNGSKGSCDGNKQGNNNHLVAWRDKFMPQNIIQHENSMAWEQ
jgi:hypothetical protein